MTVFVTRFAVNKTVLQVVIWVDPLDGTYELVAAEGNICKFYFHCQTFSLLISHSSVSLILSHLIN